MIPKELLYYFRRYKTRYGADFICLLAATGIVMLPPIVIRSAIDAIDAGTTRWQLARYALMIVGLCLAESVVRFTSRRLISGTSRRVEYEMRNDLASRLMQLDQAYYLRAQTGDLMARCTNDLQRVRDLAGPAMLDITRTVILMLLGFAFMLSINVRLSLIALAYFPLVAVIIVRYRNTVEAKYRAVQDQFGELSNRVQENISGIRAIKAYAQEDSETETFARANRELMRRTMSWAFYMGAFWPLMGLSAGGSVALILWFGGHEVVAGHLTIGAFVQFNAYLTILSGALMPLGWTVTMAQQGLASLKRVVEVLAAEPGIKDVGPGVTLAPPRGEIEFRDVSFGYFPDEPVLRHVNLKIPAGSTVAIVGGTGEGKTTLVNLLVRLHDPWSGQVLLDEVDIRELPLAELRERIGFVPQETFLFSESLLDNIVLGKEDATPAEVEYVLQTSQLAQDLPQLTRGIETILGERGVTLSGGQKQRTALARALLKDPPVVVLDDAMSHVDTHTEEEILLRLCTFMQQRTTILIAHRTSTLATADFIVALADGGIAEQGRHAELIARDGVYARFYRRQLLVEQIEDGTEAGSVAGERA